MPYTLNNFLPALKSPLIPRSDPWLPDANSHPPCTPYHSQPPSRLKTAPASTFRPPAPPTSPVAPKRSTTPTPGDLSALPSYKPEVQASGTIREWGSNYFADSNLNSYWETAFHKFQPDIKFDVHMRTALEAAPALATGVADLAACRLFTFSDEELYERAFNHEPLRILIATGSYDVPGWSPALAIVTNKDNPITQLTVQQLDGIFGAARSGGYQGTTWHPEAGRPASQNIPHLGPARPHRKMERRPHPRLRPQPSSTAWPATSRPWSSRAATSGPNPLRSTPTTPAPTAPSKSAAEQLMLDLAKDPLGIGYSGAMFLNSGTKMLAIAEKPGAPYVPPQH